jgi:hypothetical protein
LNRSEPLVFASLDDLEFLEGARKVWRERCRDEILEKGSAAFQTRMAGSPEPAIARKQSEEIGHSDVGAIFFGQPGEAVAAASGAFPASEANADVRIGGQSVAGHEENITRTFWP